jgi:VRR-NUC domain
MASVERYYRTRQRVIKRVKERIRLRESETELQGVLVVYLNTVLRDRLVFAVPNAARRTKGGRAANAIPGLFPGFPDLGVCLLHGRVLWLEAKTEDGELSEQQEKTHRLLRDLGHVVEVVRSVEDTRRALRTHKVPTREARYVEPV